MKISKVRRTDHRPPGQSGKPALERNARPVVEPARLTQRKCNVCACLFTPPKYSQRVCCSSECSNKLRNAERVKSQYWWMNSAGYLEGCVWENGVRRRVRKHRWIMEKHLGRSLTQFEEVHHKDGNKLNNDISNLEVLDGVEHARLHNRDRWRKSGDSRRKSVINRLAARSHARAIKSGRAKA